MLKLTLLATTLLFSNVSQCAVAQGFFLGDLEEDPAPTVEGMEPTTLSTSCLERQNSQVTLYPGEVYTNGVLRIRLDNFFIDDNSRAILRIRSNSVYFNAEFDVTDSDGDFRRTDVNGICAGVEVSMKCFQEVWDRSNRDRIETSWKYNCLFSEF